MIVAPGDILHVELSLTAACTTEYIVFYGHLNVPLFEPKVELQVELPHCRLYCMLGSNSMHLEFFRSRQSDGFANLKE